MQCVVEEDAAEKLVQDVACSGSDLVPGKYEGGPAGQCWLSCHALGGSQWGREGPGPLTRGFTAVPSIMSWRSTKHHELAQCVVWIGQPARSGLWRVPLDPIKAGARSRPATLRSLHHARTLPNKQVASSFGREPRIWPGSW